MTVPVDLAPRVASFDVSAHPLPDRHDEGWRFAALPQFVDLLGPVPGAGSVRLAGPIPHAADVEPTRDGWVPTDRVAAIAAGEATSRVEVTIPDDHAMVEPVIVRLTADGPFAYEQVRLRFGANSRATIVVEQVADADLTGAIEVEVGVGASATVVLEWVGTVDQRAIVHIPVVVGASASLTLATLVAGGRALRILPSVRYRGTGGTARILGSFLVQDDAHLEQRVLVEHEEPHCSSRVEYKGALSGRGARSVWIGDVLVRSTAVGTDTYEMNRNLLLDDGPRADSVPNLELETGDIVSAGHASATGRFDEEQLFYLQARGIPEAVARQLVVRGFFADVLAAIPDPGLRYRLDQLISARLGLPINHDGWELP